MPRAGARRKKTRTHVVENEVAQSALTTNEILKVPKSLIVSQERYCCVRQKLPHFFSPLSPPFRPFHLRSVEARSNPKFPRLLTTYERSCCLTRL